MLGHKLRFVLLACLILPFPVAAEQPWTFSNNTRYLAMGDSLAAGYGAIPATQGYTYLLYQGGVYDSLTNTLFANAAVPGATSDDVLAYQVPQASFFQPHVITISVGGNDLLKILNGADPIVTLGQFQQNLLQILGGLHAALPDARIYIHNFYDIPEITGQIPGGPQIIEALNGIIAGVAPAFGVGVADVFSRFEGRRGLLLIERNGAGQFEVHPTNAGYRVMMRAFDEAAAMQ